MSKPPILRSSERRKASRARRRYRFLSTDAPNRVDTVIPKRQHGRRVFIHWMTKYSVEKVFPFCESHMNSLRSFIRRKPGKAKKRPTCSPTPEPTGSDLLFYGFEEFYDHDASSCASEIHALSGAFFCLVDRYALPYNFRP